MMDAIAALKKVIEILIEEDKKFMELIEYLGKANIDLDIDCSAYLALQKIVGDNLDYFAEEVEGIQADEDDKEERLVFLAEKAFENLKTK